MFRQTPRLFAREPAIKYLGQTLEINRAGVQQASMSASGVINKLEDWKTAPQLREPDNGGRELYHHQPAADMFII
jgi:hypothetical protein